MKLRSTLFGLNLGPNALASGRQVMLPIMLACLLAIIWEAGAKIANVSPSVMAPPSSVWRILNATFFILMQQSVSTVRECVFGFLIAAGVGMVLGGVLVLSRRAQQAVYPYALFFQLIPKVAVAPLFIVWFGVGPTSRLCLAAFMGFFPILLATVTGLMSADRNVLRMAESVTASPWQIFWSIQLPYSMPHVFGGLKVGLSMAIIGVIIGEFITGQSGLGYVIMLGTSAADTALSFAAIALLAVLGLVLYGAVSLLEWFVERRMGVSITTNEF
jgi:NitT/TauT family transport system permease protein